MSESQTIRAQTIGELNGPWVRAFKAAPLIGGAGLSACVAACIWIATVMRDIDRRAESNSGRILALEQTRPTQGDITSLRADIASLRERLARIPDDLSPGDQMRAQIQAIAGRQEVMLEQIHRLALDVAALKRGGP